MPRISTLFCSALLSLPLAAQLTTPKVGVARFSDGSLHSIQGLVDNMIVCDLPFDSIDAASFSDEGGLVSQQGVVRLLAADFSVLGEYKSGETAPILNIEADLMSAMAWLPSKHQLVRWDGSKFAVVTLAGSDVAGQVTGLQAVNSKQARLLVNGPDGLVSSLTVSTRNGSLISSEPLNGVHRYAFGQSFFLLYPEQQRLIVDSMNGYRRSVGIPATDLLVERMSSQWLHLYSPSLKQDWALHLTQSELKLSQLPAVAAQPAHVSVSRTSIPGEPQ